MKCSLDINKTVEGGKSMHDSYDTMKRGKKENKCNEKWKETMKQKDKCSISLYFAVGNNDKPWLRGWIWVYFRKRNWKGVNDGIENKKLVVLSAQ